MLNKLFRASRPATLLVAILSTFLGIITSYRQGYIFQNYLWDVWRIFLVVTAAVLLQSGMNMMNNYFEQGERKSVLEKLTFRAGIILFVITALIGIYLAFYSGIQLLIIEVIGIFAAYAYAGEPFNYKRFGLGAIMSFVMMGPLMAYASFFVFSKCFSILPIIYSFTGGLFIPAILLANELRDYKEDKDNNVLTLTVRIGYEKGKLLYYALITLAYINIIILVIVKCLPPLSMIVLSTIPLIREIIRSVKYNKKRLIQLTAKMYLFFCMQLFLVLILTK